MQPPFSFFFGPTSLCTDLPLLLKQNGERDNFFWGKWASVHRRGPTGLGFSLLSNTEQYCPVTNASSMDIKHGTRGRVGQGRGDVKHRDAGDAGREWLLQKSEVNAISVTFLVNMSWWRQPTLPSLGFLHACLRSEDSEKTPCNEESETVVLVFLLMEYWSPKQGRVGCGRQSFSRITAFDFK